MIYISHKLDEVFEIADRVTVLRDGAYIGTVNAAETDQRQLIGMMVGRPLSDLFPRTDAPIGDEVLRAEDLALAGNKQAGTRAVGPVSLSLRRGEILGVAGLMGAGRTELLEALFGVHGRRRRERPAVPRRPRAADQLAAGGDRCRPGVRHRGPQDAEPDHRDVGQAQRHARRPAPLLRFNLLRQRAEDAAVQRSITELQIKTPSASAAVETLSGGNQQKVALAKCAS